MLLSSFLANAFATGLAVSRVNVTSVRGCLLWLRKNGDTLLMSEIRLLIENSAMGSQSAQSVCQAFTHICRYLMTSPLARSVRPSV